MNVPILTILLLLVWIYITYKVPWLFYRHLLNPHYRWYQEGNICYQEAREFSIVWCILINVITGVINYSAFSWT